MRRGVIRGVHFEERRVVPRLEDAAPGQVGEINFPFGSIVVSKPNPVVRECFDFDRFRHDQSPRGYDTASCGERPFLKSGSRDVILSA
jgi:hypothetical protein